MTTFPGTSTITRNYKYTENAFLPKIVTIPLVQEKDSFCSPLVHPGDRIEEGNIIAKPDNIKYTNIHSPVPGVVIDTVNIVCPDGRYEQSVRIKTAGSFSYLGKKIEKVDWTKFSDEELINIISDKGVINTFVANEPVSLASEIKNITNKSTNNLVVRLFDDDPFRNTDSLMSKIYREEIFEGARIIGKAIKADFIYYYANQKDLDVLEEIQKEELKSNEKLVIIEGKKYPSGFKMEIAKKASFKSLIKASDIKISKNDLFIDSVTLYDVYNAVCFNQPVISKHVLFSGNCLQASCLLNVKVGTMVGDIVKQIGNLIAEPALVVINGKITGYSLANTDFPITKYVKSVEIFSAKNKPDQHIYNCISCGSCRTICPRHLSPDMLYSYLTENKKVPEQYVVSASYCQNCGLCNTVCPSRIPLCQTISLISKNAAELTADTEKKED